MVGDLSENNIFICIKHFREKDIIRFDRALQANGTYSEIPRIRPTHRPNAVPVIFQGCPSHFTSTAPTSKRLVENLGKKSAGPSLVSASPSASVQQTDASAAAEAHGAAAARRGQGQRDQVRYCLLLSTCTSTWG